VGPKPRRFPISLVNQAISNLQAPVALFAAKQAAESFGRFETAAARSDRRLHGRIPEPVSVVDGSDERTLCSGAPGRVLVPGRGSRGARGHREDRAEDKGPDRQKRIRADREGSGLTATGPG